MSRRDAAQILAMVTWAERQLKKIKARAQLDIDVQFPEESLHGSVDGVVVSKSTRVQNKPRLKADDPVRFAEWVAARWPTEVVPSVAPAFAEQLLERMLGNPAGVLVDDDGVVCEWVRLDQSDPYTRTSLTKDADAALAPLLAGRSLTDLVAFVENEPQNLDGAA